MAKIGARELELRQRREQKYELAQKATKTSRGSTEGRAGHPRSVRKGNSSPVGDDLASQTQQAGIKPGPRGTKPKARSSEVESAAHNGWVAGSNPAAPTKIKRGRPRIGEKASKPWVAAGMTKSTWYRRQAERAKKNV